MIKNSYPGKFIVIEGLDGSGQSTQVALLKDFLIKQGFEVITTKEPTQSSEAGKKIKEILEKKIQSESIQFQKLFAQDRLAHLENTITPALRQGKTVISDRYFFSSFAYGTADGADLEELIKLNNEFLLPDLTFLLKVRPKVCIGRIEKRGSVKTLFEKQERLEKVWQVYEKLFSRFKNIKIIDGEKSIEQVFEQIKSKL